MKDNSTWPPSIADNPSAGNVTIQQKHQINKVAVFGHIVAILPGVAFLIIAVWRYYSIYDNNLDLVGPAWINNCGGEQAPFLMLVFCLLNGIAAIVAGSVGRRWLTIGEGIWACAAAVMFAFWYMIMTF